MKKQQGDGATMAPPAGDVPPADSMPTADTIPPVAATPGPVSVPDFTPELLGRLKKQHLQSAEALAGGEVIKRRKISFEIDGVDCEEGIFVNPDGDYVTFKITLRGLSSGEEIKAITGIRDGAQMPFMMSKASLYALNDKALSEADRDFLWEALGSAGRQLVHIAFQGLGAASDAALGKLVSTRQEH